LWQLDREHDCRRDRDLDLCTQPAGDLDAIRAAFVRTIWTRTRPSRPPILSSAGGPAGTRRRPTEMRTPAQVSAAVRLRNQWVSRDDDRLCNSTIIIAMVEGAAGPLAIVPPLGPLVSRPGRGRKPARKERKTPSERARLDEIGG
jgi:hypothetical protein